MVVFVKCFPIAYKTLYHLQPEFSFACILMGVFSPKQMTSIGVTSARATATGVTLPHAHRV